MVVPAAFGVRNRLVRALAALPVGDGYRAAARVLAAAGCRGVPGSRDDCPLARYLTRRVRRRVTVDGTWCAVPGEPGTIVRLPSHLVALVLAVDAGRVPELLDEEGP